MSISLIFDQSPAVQALANHALKQLGFEPVSRTGFLPDLLEELTPGLLIASSPIAAEFRSILKGKSLKLLLIGETSVKVPNCLTITKPFTSEELLQRLKLLTSTPAIKITHDLRINFIDPLTAALVAKSFEARGLSTTTDAGCALLEVGDSPESSEILFESSSTLDSRVLFAEVGKLLPLVPTTPIQMPLSERERLLLSKLLIRELETKLSETTALRNREWNKLRGEIGSVLEEFFK